MKVIPLISFDTIFDIDVGVCLFIRDEDILTDVFDLNKYSFFSNNDILYSLSKRDYDNPLMSIPLRKSNIELEDLKYLTDVYNNIMINRYNEVLSRSPFTDFGYAALEMINTVDNTTVIVDSDIEKKKLVSIGINSNIIISGNVSDYINNFDPIYISKLSDILYKDISIMYKNIYIQDTKFNINKIDDIREDKDNISLILENEVSLYTLWKMKGESKNERSKL